jgi:hypothetical protein
MAVLEISRKDAVSGSPKARRFGFCRYPYGQWLSWINLEDHRVGSRLSSVPHESRLAILTYAYDDLVPAPSMQEVSSTTKSKPSQFRQYLFAR